MEKHTKYIVLGIVLVALIILGIITVRPWLQNRTVPIVVNEMVERPALGISFSFPSGEKAYSYVEPPIGTSTPGSPKAVFVMMKTDAYEEFFSGTPASEAPPTISIFVFDETEESLSTPTAGTSTKPDRMTKIRMWAEANSSLTAYNLMQGDPEELKLDGAKTLHYKASGLYQNDVYVTFYQNRFYLIVGQYDGESDPAFLVFKDLVNSVLFI